MGREIWGFVYWLLNKGCPLIGGTFYSKYEKRNLGFLFTVCLIKVVCLKEVLFTTNMGREFRDFVYCLPNTGCPLNRGTFYSKYGKRNLGL